jgi:NADH dehydrogenase [ubiquinone] 1 alpha subcomplex assembly factor 1
MLPARLDGRQQRAVFQRFSPSAGTDAGKEWQTVNDGVMAGVSDGKFKITDKKTLEFYGTLSLENDGGFASVRSKAKKLGLEKGDVLVARVRGDGRNTG